MCTQGLRGVKIGVSKLEGDKHPLTPALRKLLLDEFFLCFYCCKLRIEYPDCLYLLLA